MTEVKTRFSAKHRSHRFFACLLSLLLLSLSATQALAATAEFNWTQNAEGETVAMPVSYVPAKSFMYFGADAGALSGAQDMF